MRIRAAVVFVVLLAVLLPLMSLYMVGDGTLLGRLQTFVSYGLSLTSLLLSLFTIIVSTYTLTSELDQRQIYTLVTKPVTRFQLLAGKLIGVLAVNAVLLVLFTGSIYIMAVNIPRLAGAVSEEDQAKVINQFFTARVSLKPVVDTAAIQKEVDEAYARLVKSDPTLKEISPEAARAELRKQKELEKRAVAPGGQLVWRFENVRPLSKDEAIFIRYKLEASSDMPENMVVGRWLLGSYMKDESGARVKTSVSPIERKDVARTVQEIAIDAGVVGEDGRLDVVFLSSPNNNAVVIFPLENGLQVLYRAGTFDGNYFRGVIIIYARLAFLALMGISLATWLSFPVAILTGLVVVLAASMSGFIEESISGSGVGYVYLPVKLFLLLLPRFDQFDPSQHMVSAKMLTWGMVASVLGAMVFVKGLILWLFGVYVFNRREVAKVIV
jgi:ABC-type transport system involved in multi-copper enzyme maturation permease subunit